MRCPACDKTNPPQMVHCEECGSKLPRRARRGDSVDEIDPLGDDLHTLSPFGLPSDIHKNSRALYSYYCGVAGLVPFLGVLLGPTALVLGILGMSYARGNPRAIGNSHAVVGLVMGASELVLNGTGIALMVMGLTMQR